MSVPKDNYKMEANYMNNISNGRERCKNIINLANSQLSNYGSNILKEP
jgi:hypothetical protein